MAAQVSHIVPGTTLLLDPGQVPSGVQFHTLGASLETLGCQTNPAAFQPVIAGCQVILIRAPPTSTFLISNSGYEQSHLTKDKAAPRSAEEPLKKL